MKHIQLFEAWDETPAESENTYGTPRRNMVPDLSSLRDTQEYQDLLAAGFTEDTDHPQGFRMGNIRFAHPALGKKTVRVNQNGAIFMDDPSGKTFLIDRGSPLMSIEDYAAKLTGLPQMLPQS